jgi:hypothetical protein
LGMIARGIASLLLVTQLGSVAQPAFSSLAGGHESGCTMLAQHDESMDGHGSPAFDTPRDCAACHIPGCLNMHACSNRGPAIVPESDPIPAGVLLSETDLEAVGSEDDRFTRLIPPPPRS